jgi:hypothetical protein
MGICGNKRFTWANKPFIHGDVGSDPGMDIIDLDAVVSGIAAAYLLVYGVFLG